MCEMNYFLDFHLSTSLRGFNPSFMRSAFACHFMFVGGRGREGGGEERKKQSEQQRANKRKRELYEENPCTHKGIFAGFRSHFLALSLSRSSSRTKTHLINLSVNFSLVALACAITLGLAPTLRPPASSILLLRFLCVCACVCV